MTPQPHKYQSNEVLLALDHISLSYQGTSVLKDVHAQIRDLHEDNFVRGQVVGLLGPSGIGKTQLFKIMSGMQRSDFSGQVLIGQDQHPIRRGEVGVVAQSYPLFEHRTVLGNMLAAIRDCSGKEAVDKAMNMLREFDLAEKANLYWSQLSGGQRQRASTAQQLLCSGHFLLMDEPFSGQDPVRVKKACKFIEQIASRDELNTIILISQTIEPVVAVADTLWLLGRDRDEKGDPIPGAYIKEEINLIDRGIAWQENVRQLPAFADLVRELNDKFDTL